MASRGSMTDIHDAVSVEDRNKLKTAYKEKGAKGLIDVILQNKDKWNSMPLKIAVTGTSGSGKSSFINTFRGLSARQDGAAGVGVTETTKEIKSYHSNGNKKFVLFDLPGVGSQDFPRESYPEDVSFDRFDFFIIITSCRFTENDIWLGKKVASHGKQCFYVRTKIDSDIENEKHDNGVENNSEPNEDAIFEQIRQNTQRCIYEAQIVVPVYLISNRLNMRNKFDFLRLEEEVNKSAMNLRKGDLRRLLQNLTENVIDEKIKLLEKSASGTTIASAIGIAIPLPGVSVGVDAMVVQNEADVYRKKLFLDEDSLEGLKDTINIDELRLACRETQFAKENDITGAVAANLVGTVFKICLPIVGSILAVMIFSDEVPIRLRKILEKLNEDAVKISRRTLEQLI